MTVDRTLQGPLSQVKALREQLAKYERDGDRSFGDAPGGTSGGAGLALSDGPYVGSYARAIDAGQNRERHIFYGGGAPALPLDEATGGSVGPPSTGGGGLKAGGPGGTSGDMGEDWKASVDRQLAQLHGDVRNLLYGLIASFIALGGGGWLIYDKLSEQMTILRVEQAKAAGDVATRDAVTNGKLDRLLERREAAPPPRRP